MPWVFFPGRPDYQPRNPLRAALLAAAAPAESAPPWIRLFQLSSGYPWWLPWRHVARPLRGVRPVRDLRRLDEPVLALVTASSRRLERDGPLRGAVSLI
jgi:hypothetical protein